MGAGQQVGGEAGDMIGSLIAEALSQGDYRRAEELIRQAGKSHEGIGLTGPAEQMGASEFEGVGLDKQSMDARRMALRRFQQIGLEGGLDPESRAAMAEAQGQASQYERGQRGALMQRAQERGGLGGGGLNAASLIAQQEGSNRMAQAGTQAAGDARRRALQALQASEGIASGLTADEYRKSADRAAAMDAVNKFNVGLRQDSKNRRFEEQMALADAAREGKMMESDIYGLRAKRRKELGSKTGRGVGGLVGTGVDAYAGGA